MVLINIDLLSFVAGGVFCAIPTAFIIRNNPAKAAALEAAIQAKAEPLLLRIETMTQRVENAVQAKVAQTEQTIKADVTKAVEAPVAAIEADVKKVENAL